MIEIKKQIFSDTILWEKIDLNFMKPIASLYGWHKNKNETASLLEKNITNVINKYENINCIIISKKNYELIYNHAKPIHSAYQTIRWCTNIKDDDILLSNTNLSYDRIKILVERKLKLEKIFE